MKKSYQRLTASVILLSLLLSFLPPQAKLLAEENGLSSQETELVASENESTSTSLETSRFSEAGTTQSQTEMKTTTSGSSQGTGETDAFKASEATVSESSENAALTESGETTGSAGSTPSTDLDNSAETSLSKLTESEPEFQALAQAAEMSDLSFKVDFKDGGFIFGASSRILPELALYRTIEGGEEELLTTNIEEYFRYYKQGNTYAYSSKTKFPVTDANGRPYTYKLKPVFLSDSSYYVGDLSYDSIEKDRYFSSQEEMNITPGI